MADRRIEAIAFDAYGTLFDVYSVVELCRRLFGDPAGAITRVWRQKQLEYTWLLSLMGRYEPFSDVTRRALDYALAANAITGRQADRDELLGAYYTLDCFPEVADALQALGDRPLAILSNGTPSMLRAVVEHAGLDRAFDRIISAHEVGVFKPNPAVYGLAVAHLSVSHPARIAFVSSNAWDICGASAFGLTTCWVNRAGAPAETLDLSADVMVGELTALAEWIGEAS